MGLREPKIKYRIMSFNIKQFSDNSAFHKSGSDSKKDLETIARIVRDNNIDIIAIQEIRGKIAFKELISAIAYGYSKDITYELLEQPTYDDKTLSSEMVGSDYLACKAGKWQGRWTHPNSRWGTAISEEGYAFIWNTETIELPSNDKGIIQPVIKHKKEAYFVRPPFYGRFVPCKIKPKFEIRLLNTHILYTKNAQLKKLKDMDSNIDIELLNSPIKEERLKIKKLLIESGLSPAEISSLESTLNKSDVDRRRDEVRNLINEILVREEDYRGNGSYVFMLGDYNLNLADSSSQFKNRAATIDRTIIYGAGTKNDIREYSIVQDELTTLRIPPKEESDECNTLFGEERFANSYDHFTYNKNMTENGDGIGRDIYVSNPKRIEVMDIYGMTNREYFDRISDHLPIVIEIGFGRA